MNDSKSDSIIVTGFGPFRNCSVNPSWEAVKLLPDEFNGIHIIKEEIPVQYVHVETKIPQLWKKYNPLLVIHVGVSHEARALTIEKCANREGYTQTDSAGLAHPTGVACTTGEKCIFTGLNLEDICKHVNNTGKIKACLSDDAGRYLCEFIYYTSLNQDPSKALFIHVPPLDEPYSAKEVSEGILEIIKCVLDQQLTKEDCICAISV